MSRFTLLVTPELCPHHSHPSMSAPAAGLAVEIAHHHRLYHQLDYDALIRRNAIIKVRHPQLRRTGSPSLRVGAAPVVGFGKVRHTAPMLSMGNDAAAVQRFFRKAMKKAGELWKSTKLRQVKSLNNIVEQDHRHIKRLLSPGLDFKSVHTAHRTIAGYEIMAMVLKGQVAAMPAQATFIASLLGLAA